MSPRKIDPLTHYTVEDRGYETACWIWKGSIPKSGYCNVSVNGKNELVHRLFYRHYKGELIGDPPKVPGTNGNPMEVHHRCNQRACVNPEHLQGIKQKEHLRMHKTRGVEGRKNKCFSLKPTTISALRELAQQAHMTERDYVDWIIEQQVKKEEQCQET